MYAVIETGGKQYRVRPGETLEVELLPAQPGNEVALERVLLVVDENQTLVGQPVVPGAAVVGTVVREGRGKKIIVFKYKSKKRYRRTTGHRQDYSYLTITDIQADGKSLLADGESAKLKERADRAAHRYEIALLAQLGLTEEIIAEAHDQDVLADSGATEPNLGRIKGRQKGRQAPAAAGDEPTASH